MNSPRVGEVARQEKIFKYYMKANCTLKTTHHTLRNFLLCIWLAACLPVQIQGQAIYSTPAYTFTTLAGLTGSSGTNDGTGSAAIDNAGNIYLTDSVNNTVRKGVPTSSVPAPLLLPPSLNDGKFGFGITGFPGLAVDIQSSADLSHWQVAGTYSLNGGSNYFVSPTTTQGTLFYRAHVR